PKDRRDEAKDYLFSAILSLKTIDECYDFFDDLCTIKEVNEMAKRLCGAKMLDQNKVYTEITEKTGLSTATISRINRALKYGSDGYNNVLRNLESADVKPPRFIDTDGMTIDSNEKSE
ncbi:MAG: hypothetical protein E7672_09500, partial [Ruminococcaceae bacterium]|nr:hypothetical protein [Oscillospiraceae bacterium]